MTGNKDDQALGKLVVVGLHGETVRTVRILSSLMWFYRIEAVEVTPLRGQRFLLPGERAWVPKYAVLRLD